MAQPFESGKAKGSVPATWDGAEFSIGLNANYVQDFLRLIPPAVAFDFRFSDHTPKLDLDGNATGEVIPHATQFSIPGWRYVVMPLRV